MENFPNLTHLYLQRNFIVRIENLNCLKKLKKIYLGRNEIQVLEGMGDLHEIKEIHLENQDLSIGDTMYFEPLTILNLGVSGSYFEEKIFIFNHFFFFFRQPFKS